MGTIVTTTIGVGFNVPEEVFEDLPEDTLEDAFYGGGYKLLDYRNSYFYDYAEANQYVYVKRLTKTFYGTGFDEFPAELILDGPNDAERAELQKLAQTLGIDIVVTRFVETSVG